MNRAFYNHRNALQDFLGHKIEERGSFGINRARLIGMAKSQGYLPSDARQALHKMAMIQQIEFVSSPIEIRVRAATGKATDKPVGVL